MAKSWFYFGSLIVDVHLGRNNIKGRGSRGKSRLPVIGPRSNALLLGPANNRTALPRAKPSGLLLTRRSKGRRRRITRDFMLKPTPSRLRTARFKVEVFLDGSCFWLRSLRSRFPYDLTPMNFVTNWTSRGLPGGPRKNTEKRCYDTFKNYQLLVI